MHPRTGSHRRAAAIAWAFGMLTACSPGFKDGGNTGSMADGGSTNTDSGSTDGGTDVLDGTWWQVDGEVVVSAGAPQVDGSTLVFSRRSGDESACQDVVSPTVLASDEAPPHATVFTWWRVEWDPMGITCFGAGEGAARQPLMLGVGQMHPELEAVLPSLLGETDAAALGHLNGAYLQLPGDDRLLVFGVIGPESAWAGEGEPAMAAPLADGTWLLRSAYSLPLSW